MILYDGYGSFLGGSAGGLEGNQLSGKVWLPIGDSITNSSGYPAIACASYGMRELTGGHAGGRQVGYAKGSANCALEQLEKIASGTPDIITIALGTNDWGNSCPLGTIADNPADQNESAYTFFGCYKKLIEMLYDRYPDVPLVLMTPFKRNGFTGMNSAGYTLEECADAVLQIAGYYSCLCCDLFRESGLSVGVIDAVTEQATSDGLHYNRTAMAVAVPKMARSMDLAIRRCYIPCTSMGQSGSAYTLTDTAAQRIYVSVNSSCTEQVSWKSTDESVVRVVPERGYIYANLYAVASGTASVVATCDGISAVFAVTVALE